MSTSSSSLAALAQFEQAIGAAPDHRYAEITRQITNLFVSHSAEYSDEQIRLFGQVLQRLISKIENQVLAELGERLSSVPRAPEEVILELARRDDIAVAGPILANSTALREADLIELSETKSQAHLLAISERNVLTTGVTDVLVRRGDTGVARSVASNPGAQFSVFGFETLSTRADSDEVLAEKIAQRGDVPPHIFCQILMRASDAVRCRILAAAPPAMHGDLGAILDDIAGQMADAAPVTHDFGSATRQILRAFPDGKIDEADVLRYASARRYEETVAALSVKSAISVDTIHQLMSDHRIEPLQFLGKALGFGWSCMHPLIDLKLGKPMRPETLEAAEDQFEKLRPEVSERMLAIWQARDSA